MKSSVVINLVMPVNTLPELLSALRALERREVVVGWPAAGPDRADGDKANNATIAYVQDQGSPAQNIPATHVLANGIEDRRVMIEKRLVDGGKAVLNSNRSGLEKNLIAAGMTAVDGIKARVNSNPPPPLAKKTIAARRRKGFMGTKRLVRSGQLLASVNFAVRDRGKL